MSISVIKTQILKNLKTNSAIMVPSLLEKIIPLAAQTISAIQIIKTLRMCYATSKNAVDVPAQTKSSKRLRKIPKICFETMEMLKVVLFLTISTRRKKWINILRIPKIKLRILRNGSNNKNSKISNNSKIYGMSNKMNFTKNIKNSSGRFVLISMRTTLQYMCWDLR